MATTSAAVRQLSDGNSQGTSLGNSATDKISFYNATPVVQSSIIGASIGGASTTALLTNTSGAGVSTWGFATSSQANQVISAMLQLKTLGLIA